jgi:hypothetical protein
MRAGSYAIGTAGMAANQPTATTAFRKYLVKHEADLKAILQVER